MSLHPNLHQWTQNEKLIQWIQRTIALCKPSHVHLCDGSKNEYIRLCQEMVEKGIFVQLNLSKRPGSFWCHSSADDVARVEEATFICSKTKEQAGPTNNWKDPHEMRSLLKGLFRGCMSGRTMYVIPFCMGPLNSPISHIGVQITDSPYVVCSMYIMTRMGKKALDVLGKKILFLVSIQLEFLCFKEKKMSRGLPDLIKNTLSIFLRKEVFGLLEVDMEGTLF